MYNLINPLVGFQLNLKLNKKPITILNYNVTIFLRVNNNSGAP